MRETKLGLGAVIPLCIAIAAGTWAVTAEIHNARLKVAETDIAVSKDDRTQIWRAIDRSAEGMDYMRAAIQEIKADVKELLKQQK
jgi:hypothetical protein